MQNTKIITLEYQVRCDQCGMPIHVGEKCRLVTNAAGGWVRFEHLRCPGTGVFSLRLPKFPRLPLLSNNLILA